MTSVRPKSVRLLAFDRVSKESVLHDYSHRFGGHPIRRRHRLGRYLSSLRCRYTSWFRFSWIHEKIILQWKIWDRFVILLVCEKQEKRYRRFRFLLSFASLSCYVLLNVYGSSSRKWNMSENFSFRVPQMILKIDQKKKRTFWVLLFFAGTLMKLLTSVPCPIIEVALPWSAFLSYYLSAKRTSIEPFLFLELSNVKIPELCSSSSRHILDGFFHDVLLGVWKI